MRVLIATLLLVVGVNEIIARSFSWFDDNYHLGFMDDHFENNLYMRTLVESSEELKDIDDHDDADDKNENSSVDEKNNPFDIDLYNIFAIHEPKSSEEKNNDEGEREENWGTNIEEDKSDENSDETKTNNFANEKLLDLTKSSEEKKYDVDVEEEISEKDIKELTNLLFTLNILGDLMNIANTDEYTDIETQDNQSQSKEVDEYLALVSLVLDKVVTDKLNGKETNDIENTLSNSDEDDDSKELATSKYESKEEEEDDDDNKDNNEIITTVAAENDSDENNKNSNEEDEKNNTSDSDSNEKESELISIVFHGINEADAQQNLNNHKYNIEKPLAQFTTFAPQSIDTSTSNDHNIINQYVEIREGLDNQQDALERNELTLDKDFYAIISGNHYDEESLNKFEKDIYVMAENFDRIKRNINAMQNLNTKLYFRKVLNTAIKEFQNKSMN